MPDTLTAPEQSVKIEESKRAPILQNKPNCATRNILLREYIYRRLKWQKGRRMVRTPEQFRKAQLASVASRRAKRIAAAKAYLATITNPTTTTK